MTYPNSTKNNSLSLSFSFFSFIGRMKLIYVTCKTIFRFLNAVNTIIHCSILGPFLKPKMVRQIIFHSMMANVHRINHQLQHHSIEKLSNIICRKSFFFSFFFHVRVCVCECVLKPSYSICVIHSIDSKWKIKCKKKKQTQNINLLLRYTCTITQHSSPFSISISKIQTLPRHDCRQKRKKKNKSYESKYEYAQIYKWTNCSK